MDKKIYRALCVVLLSVLFGGCNTTRHLMPEPLVDDLYPQQARITESVITSDRSVLAKTQERLQAVNRAGRAVDDYHFCKAQAWLDFATNEYDDNDRTGVVIAALTESVELIDRLERSQHSKDVALPMSTSIIKTSKRMRDDIWQFVEQHKQTAATCSACDLAKLEVQLVWVGHEDNELGWRHALSAVAAAERLQRQVVNASASCSEHVVPEHDCAPIQPWIAPAAPYEAPSLAGVSIPRYVHFALNESTLSGKSLEIIQLLASVMRVNPEINIELVGHTDLRGGVKFNHALAHARVQTVKAGLIKEGISEERLAVYEKGPERPRAVGATIKSHAQNRRVEIVIASGRAIELVPLEHDLQLESVAQ